MPDLSTEQIVKSELEVVRTRLKSDIKSSVKLYFAEVDKIKENYRDCSFLGCNHQHLCEFRMLYGAKDGQKHCKQFWKNKGVNVTFDKWYNPTEGSDRCDLCDHSKYVVLDDDDGIIAII